MPTSRRAIALGVVTLLLGSVLAVVPQPVIAIEKGTRLDTIVPDLEPRSSPAPGADTGELTTQSEARLFASERVRDFELIGATFTSDQIEDGRIRVLVNGRWRRWEALTNVEGDHGPEPGSAEAAEAKPASDPIWVGDGEGFELDLPGDATEVAVHLVRETEDRVVIDGTEEAGAYRMPRFRGRRAWGARPPSRQPGKAKTVKRAVVHHTVNSNSYSPGAVPGMIRSIQRYHMGAQGWWDIGYNFIVDRFGRRWVGRARSLYQPTIGAHAKGSNTGSTGIAYLGNGTGVPMTRKAREATSRLIAWKLPLHGTFFGGRAIVGHRDVFSTSCPGNAIHRQLGGIRTRARKLRPPKGPFLDVRRSAWNATALRWAKANGIVTAYRDGNFRPKRNLARGAAVRLVWATSGRPRVAAAHGFTDVRPGTPLNTALKWAKARGIVTASADNTFRPGHRATRSFLVVGLHRAAGQPRAPVDAGYSDVASGSTLDHAVDWARWFGALRRYGGAEFRPARAVLRGEAVPIVHAVRPFNDTRGRSFKPAADWALYHQIVDRLPRNTFRGSNPASRGAGIAVLWKAMGSPAGAPDHSWPDAPTTAWYDRALDWGTDAGIVDGLSGGTDFGPTAPLTRADVALWAWRAAGSPTASQPHGMTDVPPDAPYGDALDWAIEHGVLSGYEDGTFHPDEAVTRAQWATALYLLAGSPSAWAGGAPPPFTARF